MKKLLEFILESIVDHPKDVEVKLSDQENQVVLSIMVNPKDMGMVIGRNGKIIRSIRNLLRAKGIKEEKQVQVVLQENAQKENGFDLPLPSSGENDVEGK